MWLLSYMFVHLPFLPGAITFPLPDIMLSISKQLQGHVNCLKDSNEIPAIFYSLKFLHRFFVIQVWLSVGRTIWKRNECVLWNCNVWLPEMCDELLCEHVAGFLLLCLHLYLLCFLGHSCYALPSKKEGFKMT